MRPERTFHNQGTSTATAVRLLDECTSGWGKPGEITAGHDARCRAMRGGKPQFGTKPEELGIEHIMAAVGMPTATKEIERWSRPMTGRLGGS